MFGIPYSYWRVSYSKTTSTNNLEIIPEYLLPDAISQFDVSRLAPFEIGDYA